MLIPKDIGRGLFSPSLMATKNPKLTFSLSPFGTGAPISAVLTYYNSKNFGGTRDEFRLTRISTFISSAQLNPGDVLEIELVAKTFTGTISFIRSKVGGHDQVH